MKRHTQIYFITGNAGKFNEAKAMLPELKQLNIDLPELQETDQKKIIETKLHEARKHAKTRKHVKGLYIVEDTSLAFDCLGGLPGPFIKWFIKSIGNEGLFRLTKKMRNNHAEATTMIGYADAKEYAHYFRGTIKGRIVSPKGKGFGWDPIFMPDNHKKRLSEMKREEKNSISMRGKAFLQLKKHLAKKK